MKFAKKIAMFSACCAVIFNHSVSADSSSRPVNGPASSYAGSITAEEWDSFSSSFMTAEGRVTDTANADISHSEGQGYGLLLAWKAGDREDFERIWTFTRREMQIRNDGLFAWKWDPAASPRITDVNNATDGDILIAYALDAAGQQWSRGDYMSYSASILRSLQPDLLPKRSGMTLIIPGKNGFENDGNVTLNPSYWVFEALSHFSHTDQSGPWSRARISGYAILSEWLHSGASEAPPEWLSLSDDGRVSGSATSGSGFGYNALRVPLYVVRDGQKTSSDIARMASSMVDEDGNLTLRSADGEITEILSDTGYKALASLIRCSIIGESEGSIPKFSPTDYYPSVIHLLTLSAARTKAPECVTGK